MSNPRCLRPLNLFTASLGGKLSSRHSETLEEKASTVSEVRHITKHACGRVWYGVETGGRQNNNLMELLGDLEEHVQQIAACILYFEELAKV